MKTEHLPRLFDRKDGPDPEVLYFGWTYPAGHHLNRPRSRMGVSRRFDEQPWGTKIDTGLCPAPEPKKINGHIAVHHKDGWTAVAFWDRSGDIRPGSCTVFLTGADVSASQLLALARRQWPHVFERNGFPLNKASEIIDNPHYDI
jgi:hypothetical protein